jgi:hypothetical protein
MGFPPCGDAEKLSKRVSHLNRVRKNEDPVKPGTDHEPSWLAVAKNALGKKIGSGAAMSVGLLRLGDQARSG